MRIESEVGKGTTISISLSVGQAQADLESLTLVEHTVQPMSILLVDDGPVVREVMAALLTSEGYTVTQAASGLKGLDKFQRQPCGIVITDRAMPNMNGVELATSVKTVSPDTPFVMLSGFGVIMGDEDDLPEGVDYLVRKPATIEALRIAVASLASVPQNAMHRGATA